MWQRFAEWLDNRIARGTYADLRSFAAYLANVLNTQCGNKPLGSDECVGLLGVIVAEDVYPMQLPRFRLNAGFDHWVPPA